MMRESAGIGDRVWDNVVEHENGRPVSERVKTALMFVVAKATGDT